MIRHSGNAKRIGRFEKFMRICRKFNDSAIIKDLGERDFHIPENHGNWLYQGGGADLKGHLYSYGNAWDKSERVCREDVESEILSFMDSFANVCVDSCVSEIGLLRKKIEIKFQIEKRKNYGNQKRRLFHTDMDNYTFRGGKYQNGHVLTFFWSDECPTEFLMEPNMAAIKHRQDLHFQGMEAVVNEEQIKRFPKRHLVMANSWAFHRSPKITEDNGRNGSVAFLKVSLMDCFHAESKMLSKLVADEFWRVSGWGRGNLVWQDVFRLSEEEYNSLKSAVRSAEKHDLS